MDGNNANAAGYLLNGNLLADKFMSNLKVKVKANPNDSCSLNGWVLQDKPFNGLGENPELARPEQLASE